MEMTPPRLVAAIVERLLPPEARESVLGDLEERFRASEPRTARRQYLVDAIVTVPCVIASQMRRKADPRLLCLEAMTFYAALAGASLIERVVGFAFLSNRGLARIFVLTVVSVAAGLLADTYRTARSCSPWQEVARVCRMVGVAFLVNAALRWLARDVAVPNVIMLWGALLALVLVSAVRVLFAAADDRTEDRAAPAGSFAGLMLEKTHLFDHRVRWRNVREYTAGAIMIPVFVWKAITLGPTRRGAPFFICLFAITFVLAYIWRNHQHVRTPGPSGDAQSYRTALLARYDHQIALLRTVRYWYVLPLFVGMMSFVVARLAEGLSWGPIEFAAGATVLCLGVVWLNEVHGVRTLREQRKKVESLKNEDEV